MLLSLLSLLHIILNFRICRADRLVSRWNMVVTLVAHVSQSNFRITEVQRIMEPEI